MAYTFFPESASEIESKLKFPTPIKKEIIKLWAYLNRQYKEKAPINIDPNIKTNVNVARAIKAAGADIKKIERATKLNVIKIKFGNGSLGGRGVKNKGNAFENTFAQAILKYDEGEKVDANLEKTIIELDKIYKLSKFKKLKPEVEGGRNTPRPFQYDNFITVKSNIQKGNDLGTTVTDITIKDGDKPKVYLSLKYGNLTTFFNAGVKTVLTTQEIKAGNIENKDGLKLLNMFKIDENVFCDVFNGKLKKGIVKDVWPEMKAQDRTALYKLLQSGIGFGYHVIHKLNTGKILSFKVDEKYMMEAAKPKSCTLYYGGKTGTGKRVNMEVFTPKYKLTLNIRDTQGKDGYPTRMMCDFNYL
tara:strand:- start:45 stop:1121 length:1077 start_codon:yes stop_codon:yes gene_type:complete